MSLVSFGVDSGDCTVLRRDIVPAGTESAAVGRVGALCHDVDTGPMSGDALIPGLSPEVLEPMFEF